MSQVNAERVLWVRVEGPGPGAQCPRAGL